MFVEECLCFAGDGIASGGKPLPYKQIFNINIVFCVNEIVLEAPSGRELPTESGEGESDGLILSDQILLLRKLLPSRFACHLPLGGRLSGGANPSRMRWDSEFIS